MSTTSRFQQSPIDIDRTGLVRREVQPIEVRYRSDPVEVEVRFDVLDGDETPDGTIVAPQVVVTPTAVDAHVVVDGSRYDLQSFHWHSPAEHLFDGEALPLELHLVHMSSNDDLLVLGVLSDVGPADEAIAPAFAGIPDLGLGAGSYSATMCLTDLVPPSSGTYRYAGSLTTAPFTEGVSWFVCADLRTASIEQIAAHTKLVSAAPAGFEDRPVASARPVQDLGGRTVVTDT